MRNKNKPEFQFWVIFALIIIFAITAIIGAAANFWNYEKVIKFIFITIYELKSQISNQPPSQAPSLFAIIITTGTLVGLTFAAKFYKDQARAQIKLAILSEEENVDKRFTNAIQYLQTNNDTHILYASIETVVQTVLRNPERYYFPAIRTLQQVGEKFSKKLDKILKKDKYITDPIQVEISRFIFFMLEKLIFLKNHPSCNTWYKDKLDIKNFIINTAHTYYADGEHINFTITNKSIEFINFIGCGFAAVDFKQCNFNQTQFIDVKDLSFERCLIQGHVGTFLDPETKNIYYHFEDEEIYLKIANCYIWDTIENYESVKMFYSTLASHIVQTKVISSENYKTWMLLPDGTRTFDTWKDLPSDLCSYLNTEYHHNLPSLEKDLSQTGKSERE